MLNVLVVDDSALMRKRMCDIIDSVPQVTVADTARDGRSALDLLSHRNYDCIVMNVYMLDGSARFLLKALKAGKKHIPLIAISSAVKEDREVTVDALEAGAVEVVVRPYHFTSSEEADRFNQSLINALHAVADGNTKSATAVLRPASTPDTTSSRSRKYNLVAIACSTGGPQALNRMIPMLPAHLGVPVVIVQHMPAGFTASLAERINSEARVTVSEAKDGEVLMPDCVYIAPGGRHFAVTEDRSGRLTAHVYDGVPVHNLRPCADVMYESLCSIHTDNILCVVLTGMGSDGTEGISKLRKCKHIYTITQDENSCVVYGMPKSAYDRGLSDKQAPITEIAKAISKELGV